MFNVPLTLLIAALPIAVAGQNFAILVSGVVLIVYAVREKKLGRVFSDQVARTHLVLFALYGFTCMFSTWLNPDNSANPFVACGGYLGIWLLPGLVNSVSNDPRLDLRRYSERALKWAPIVVFVWGLIALSQMVFGWKLAGSSIVSTIPRAQGLYSHPLTLAYVALLVFPFAVSWFFRQPGRWRSQITFAGVLLLLIASKSRAAQAIGLLILVGNVWLLLKGRVRIIALAILLGLVAATLMTKNPISSRFLETLERHDVSGDYLDDRVVFWQVHWEMFKERPILGHGENLGTAYRTKYYNALGLQDFYRKYEAHNVFLQILVNSGIVGFSFFVLWFSWLLYALIKSRGVVFGSAPLQSALALLLGGITQNAFQDSEVRYALMITVIIAVLAFPRLPSSQKESSQSN